MLDFGDRLGQWRGKCVANAVLALCHGSMYGRIRARLLRQCSNRSGAGMGGTARESGNMDAVIEALKRERASVMALSADSLDLGQEGMSGKHWVLGERGTQSLGVLLWSGGHVYVLRGSAIPVGCTESFEPPPWCQVVAKGKQSRK